MISEIIFMILIITVYAVMSAIKEFIKHSMPIIVREIFSGKKPDKISAMENTEMQVKKANTQDEKPRMGTVIMVMRILIALSFILPVSSLVNILWKDPPPSRWSIFFISLNVGFIFLSFINLQFLNLYRALWRLQDSHCDTTKLLHRLINALDRNPRE